MDSVSKTKPWILFACVLEALIETEVPQFAGVVAYFGIPTWACPYRLIFLGIRKQSLRPKK